MFRRFITPSKNSSFFLFGSRGTGKTTWLKDYFRDVPHLWLDLLDQDLETELTLNPMSLVARLDQLPQETRWVVLDEVQKVPKILDIVHQQIEEKKLNFALTGSSARKLKRGSANLLAGRAFVYHFHPLTWFELHQKASVDELLRWGSLPHLFHLNNTNDKIEYLRTYAQTYLSEEIVAEQLVRNLVPFRRFLPVAAQSNGQIINFSKIARDVGADDKTIEAYYEILEDTHMGFRLYPFASSFRKRLSQKPKFYFFDVGVTRALSRQLEVPLVAQTSVYGDVFEHFVILEFYRLCAIFYPDYELTYLRTKDDAEVDLIIDRPAKPPVLVEIKSTTSVQETHVSALNTLVRDIEGAEAFCLSQDPAQKKWGQVICLPWAQGLQIILNLDKKI